jgi:hypothetical protein
MMKISTIRNLLGIFFLGITAFIGAYIILFQETVALPVSKKDAMSAFQILIPTLAAQLTIVFRWIASPPKNLEESIAIPRWAVVGPPICVILILISTLVLLIFDSGNSIDGGAIFKNSVTFCVTILSSTTIYIVVRVFGTEAVRV